jgi:hypothetical protein
MQRLSVLNFSSPTFGEGLLKILLVGVFSLLPIYIFSSGGPQLVDLFIMPISIITIIKANKYDRKIAKEILYLLPFMIYVMTVEAIYYLFYSGDNVFIIKIFQISYLFFIFFIFMVLFNKITNEKFIKYIYLGIIISILLALTIKGKSSGEYKLRISLSFNDPNQLGYFGVILSCFVILLSQYRSKRGIKGKYYLYNIMDAIILISANALVAISLSRSAILGIMFSNFYLLTRLRKKMVLVIVVIPILVITAILIIKSSFVMELITNPMITSRFSEKSIIERYESGFAQKMIFLHDWQILLGSGDGAYNRYPDQHEVHNWFGFILRCYGLIGLSLFSFWLLRMTYLTWHLKGSFWVWIGLIAYNSCNYGLRFRPFWILVAMMVVMATLLSETNRPRVNLKWLKQSFIQDRQ